MAFVAIYLALDWATYIPQLSNLGMAPWNPAAGLGFAYLLLGNPSRALVLAGAAFATDATVRQITLSWWINGIEASLIGGCYGLGVVVLRRFEPMFDKTLTSMRDLVQLIGTAAGCAALVALSYTSVLVAIGKLPAERFIESAMRYWLGDFVGIVAIAPFVLLLAANRAVVQPGRELVLQVLAVLAAVLIVFGISGRYDIELFYLLLLPVIWIAVRTGLEGASFGLVLMQVIIMVALHLGGHDPRDIGTIQAMLVVMAISGLTVGFLISERGRVERRLRLQQDAIARAARLGSMGEFASALAHELNQPLTAAGNYGRAMVGAIGKEPPSLEHAREAATKSLQQIDRSAQVIHRLRALIQVGRIDVRPHRLDDIIQESLDLMRPDMHAAEAAVFVALPQPIPRVAVDLIQIEQVLTNLLRNALEAMAEALTEKRRIAISARLLTSSQVEISIEDNGPGFPAGYSAESGLPTQSSKPDGLGVGLALCHSIVTAHGGQLFVAGGPSGAIVRFTLPLVDRNTP